MNSYLNKERKGWNIPQYKVCMIYLFKLSNILTESMPLQSKNATGPFSFSIDNMLVNNNELYCRWAPTFSLLSSANILRISFPDMLCPPVTWISCAILRMTVISSSCENQSNRKLSIPALTHESRFDMESLSSCRKIFSPLCRQDSLLCPIIKSKYHTHDIKRKGKKKTFGISHEKY